uniref:heparan sulfate glucosamine 3-O-sulfotransferase 5-like isoform X2 n=1 Tax=Styela clava TaxID=7725 RepID=UPI00193A24CE|nr:heparan sulfate glucosamine 3-O-sulfotransferase 5-like isoform X2 [Styela clava]
MFNGENRVFFINQFEMYKAARKIVLAAGLLVISIYSIYNVCFINRLPAERYEEIKNSKNFKKLKQGDTASDLEKRRKMWKKIVEPTESEKHRLPDVIGIGVRKCGTGPLLHFLRMHPLIRIGKGEMHYYDTADVEKGIEFYKNALPTASDNQLIMEKTPAYFTTLPDNLPDIIKRDSPHVKLILLLCNPVNRAFSDYAQRRTRRDNKTGNSTFKEYFDKYFYPVQKQFSTLSMEDDDAAVTDVIKTLRKDKPKFSFAYGIYAYFIRRWLKVFPPENFLILNGEDFLTDPGSVLEKVQEYLNVPKVFLKNDFIKHPKTGLFCLRPWWNETYNFRSELIPHSSWENQLYCAENTKGRTRSIIKKYDFDVGSFEKLKKFYDPYNRYLYNILGKTFDW